jgi:hypothetical protein
MTLSKLTSSALSMLFYAFMKGLEKFVESTSQWFESSETVDADGQEEKAS